MSQLSMAARPALHSETADGETTVVEAESEVHDLLTVLQDGDCRTILEATSEDALSAHEVSETCEIPTSTTYRKLDMLDEAGLVEERTRIRLSGKHASEYVRAVDDVLVSLGSEGDLVLEISRREARRSAAGTRLTAD